MNKAVYLLLAILLLAFFATRQEGFVVNDSDRFVASIDSLENRKKLANILEKNAMSKILDDRYRLSIKDSDANKGKFDFLISTGADPHSLVVRFLHRYDLLKDEYDHDTQNLIEEIQEGISEERKIKLTKRLDVVKKRLDATIEELKTLLRIYLDNRKRPNAKDNYRALSRYDLIMTIKFLKEYELPLPLFEDLVLTDNVHRKKFTLQQQRKYSSIMEALDDYWSERPEQIRRVLDSTSLPTDVSKMVTRYYSRN